MSDVSDDLVKICEIRCKSQMPLSNELLRMTLNSLRSGCYRIFTDFLGRPNGYVIWANANEETVSRVLRTGRYPIYPYEWHEGEITLILDVVKLDKSVTLLLKLLRERSLVAYKRKKFLVWGCENGFVRSKKIRD